MKLKYCTEPRTEEVTAAALERGEVVIFTQPKILAGTVAMRVYDHNTVVALTGTNAGCHYTHSDHRFRRLRNPVLIEEAK